ncbi:MAG: glycosyltransferase family 2 protein [Atopobiaceae bacterium]
MVIPCYNAHRFIRQTLASALAQSMPDLEVICINNNSTYDTRQILDEFAARDPRVKVFDEPTLGEGPARQAGLARATGDWLYFLDSDDLM